MEPDVTQTGLYLFSRVASPLELESDQWRVALSIMWRVRPSTFRARAVATTRESYIPCAREWDVTWQELNNLSGGLF